MTIRIHHLRQEAAADGDAGGGGEPTGNWRDALPEDLRGDRSLAQHGDVASLAKGYLGAQRYLAESVRIPRDDTPKEVREEFYGKLTSVPGVVRIPEPGDEEGWGQIYSKLGRPESADAYQLQELDRATVTEHFGEEEANAYFQDQEAFQGGFKETAHKAGLTQRQVDALTTWWNGMQKEALDKTIEARTSADTDLTRIFGGEQGYNRALSTIDKFIDKLLADKPDGLRDKFKADLDQTGLGNAPGLAVLLFEAAKLTMEDGELVRGDADAGGVNTEYEIERELTELTSNFESAFYDNRHPGHAAAVERVGKLREELRKLRGEPEFAPP